MTEEIKKQKYDFLINLRNESYIPVDCITDKGNIDLLEGLMNCGCVQISYYGESIYDEIRCYHITSIGCAFLYFVENELEIRRIESELLNIGIPKGLFMNYLVGRDLTLLPVQLLDYDELYQYVMDSYYPEADTEYQRYEVLNSLKLAIKKPE